MPFPWHLEKLTRGFALFPRTSVGTIIKSSRVRIAYLFALIPIRTLCCGTRCVSTTTYLSNYGSESLVVMIVNDFEPRVIAT